MSRNLERGSLALILMLFLSPCGAHAAGPQVDRVETVLRALRPDFQRYIHAVRVTPPGSSASDLYLGLVRPGGRDPRRPDDRPQAGAGRRYDLLVPVQPAALPTSPAWLRLLVDHEYFHARHLARADALPHPTFPSAAANHHFQEALAWKYNLERLLAGDYGLLEPRREREVEQRYHEHRRSFARFVRRRQPQVWPYYDRFLPARLEDRTARP